MRIAWATPFNTKSAIGRYSLEVCRALSRQGHAVEICRTETGEALQIAVLSDEFPVHPAAALDPATLRERFDVVVVNLGDYDLFHAGALELYSQPHVVSIFHDSDLRHLMVARTPAGVPLEDLAEVVPAALQVQGPAAARSERNLSLFAALSAAAVAHGPHYLHELQAACPGPVRMLPLCYPDLGSVPPNASDAEFVVTTFGMINPNKQPARVMQAIAAAPRLRERAVYHLVGPVEEHQRQRLTLLAAELGLRPPEFYGWVSDADLFRLLAQSHVICCLRYPVSEGGSASLITALYTGRPVIVADVASYALVPDNAVWKISYGDQVDDLAAALTAIEADAVLAEARGARARLWARGQYSAETYVAGLMPLLDAAIACVPAIETGRRIGAELAGMGLGVGDCAAVRIGRRIGLMLWVEGRTRGA